MEFNLVSLNISVKTDNAVRLLMWLPSSNRRFARICREIVCRWSDRECNLCTGKSDCAWQALFGQQLASNPLAVKCHQKPPLPFVFSFPAVALFTAGDTVIDCGLVVAGSAINRLEVLLEGFRQLCGDDACPARCRVIAVNSLDYQRNRSATIFVGAGWGNDNLTILSAEGILQEYHWDCQCLEVRLLSPLRLLEDGRMLSHFDFSRFAKSIMRRVSALAYYYNDYEFPEEYKELARRADAIVCTRDNFSNVPMTGGGRGGITGSGRFSGDFSGLLPFLILGTYFHVGKGAAFGMGGYAITCSAVS